MKKNTYNQPTIEIVSLEDDIILDNSPLYDPLDDFNKTGYDPTGQYK